MSHIKVVKAGTHGFYDVFFNDGWKEHTRVRVVKGRVVVISEKWKKHTPEIEGLIKKGLTKMVNQEK